MEDNSYQIFIASSLKLQTHRKIIGDAIAEVNKSQLAKDNNVVFSEFLYENRPDFAQKMEKYDAQAPADNALRHSSVFFLVIDDVIGDLTWYEFDMALQRFKSGRMPQFIFIFLNKDAAKGGKSGRSYDDLLNHNNLKDYICDSEGNVITHQKIYAIPFDNLSEGDNSLKKHVENQLERLLNGSLPYPRSFLGEHLNERHFFKDTLRLDKFPSVYYHRSVDDLLENALESSKVVLLTGDSLSGKTRAVMEALKNTDDGWVYVFDKSISSNLDLDKETVLVKRIEGLTQYLSRDNDPPKLYMVFDDIGLLVGSSDRIKEALEELVTTVLDSNSRGVLVATATEVDVGLEGISEGVQGVEMLHIDKMKKDEFNSAIRYFKACGIAVNKANYKFMRTGALFVNLTELKKRFEAYLKGSDLNSFMKQDTKDLHRCVRKILLKSIKAQSIWRDDYLGDVHLLHSMTKYFLSLLYDVGDNDMDCVFDQAVDALCEDGRMGVSKEDGGKLDIQEYVYRYFIDYEGTLQKDVFSRDKVVEEEKRLVKDILLYCKSNYYETTEPHTYQVSRLTTRCVFKKEVVDWLYRIWSGTCSEDEKKEYSAIYELLNDDREKCEKKVEGYGQKKTEHLYSKTIENYIYHCCGRKHDFEMAWKAYKASATSMRTDHLLCAVMRLAKNGKERDRVRHHEDYKRFQGKAYVIRAKVEWASLFAFALQAMQKFKTSETPQEVASRLLHPNKKQYDIVQLTRAMNTFISKVRNETHFDSALDFLRGCYPMFIKDREVLKKVKGNVLEIVPEKLTIIDLLARLNPYALDLCLKKVFGGNMDDSLTLLKKMTDAVGPTLNNGFTSETELRLLIGRTGSLLIKAAAETGYDYDEVYDTLFSALQIPHPLKGGNMVFRNSYAYTAMMQCENCKIEQAINLFENDLARHAADNDNPIYINKYTLNQLLKKCNERGRMYTRRVNLLFSQLGVKKDVVSYHNLLRGGKSGDISFDECIRIVQEMEAGNVRHNIFTLTALLACKDVDLSVGLSFFNNSEILHNHPHFMVNPFPGLEIRDEDQQRLGNNEESWYELLRKPCPTPEEKNVIGSCIEYLESEKKELLASGKIYNALVENPDFLRSATDKIKFVREKKKAGLFSPDTYTVYYISNKVREAHGKAKTDSLKHFNGLLKEYPELVKDELCTQRLYMYLSHKEQLNQVFVDKKGTIVEDLMTPIQYVEKMQELHIPLTSYTIKAITRKELENRTDEVDRKLMDLLIKQQRYYKYADHPGDSDVIRIRCPLYRDPQYSRLKLEPMSILSHNKAVVADFKRGDIDSLDKALSLLRWENENSAIVQFNTIMYYYIYSQIAIRSHDRILFKDVVRFRNDYKNLFEEVKRCYFQYFGEGKKHSPISETFSVLVRSVSSIDDFKFLFNELVNRRKTNPRLTLRPTMLARLAEVVDNVSELVSETRCFVNAGGKADAKTADRYLSCLARKLVVGRTNNNDPEANDVIKVKSLLNDVFRYIILGGDAQEALHNQEREYLFMNYFEDPANVSANTLQTIIRCNNLITNPIHRDQIVASIARNYSSCIPELMNTLFNKDREKSFISLLFWKLAPFSRPKLSAKVFGYLASLIPEGNIAKYNAFMKQLYTIDCRDIEDVAPELVRCIHRLADNVDGSANIRKTEGQIYTYSELGRLRCGHFLLENAPDEYADWCLHSLDSEHVNEILVEADESLRNEPNNDGFRNTRVKHHENDKGILINRIKQVEEKIRTKVDYLDDAFPCSLALLRKNHVRFIDLDTKAQNLITQQEDRFIARIRNGEIRFREMQHQPLLWLQAFKRPSDDLVKAMASVYADIAADKDNYYSNEAKVILNDLAESVVIADKWKSESVSVRYVTLGKFANENKAYYLMPIGKLASVLYWPMLKCLEALVKEDVKYKEEQKQALYLVERHCANYIMSHPDSVEYGKLASLPDLWMGIRRRPSQEMVQAVIKGYITIVALGKEDSDKAGQHLDQVVQAYDGVTKKAKTKNPNMKGQDSLKLMYNILGDYHYGNQYATIGINKVEEVLPENYILVLRAIAKKENPNIVLKKRLNEVMAAEQSYSSSLNNGQVQCPPSILPALWLKVGYFPSTALVQALVKYYVCYVEESSPLKVYKDAILKQINFSVQNRFYQIWFSYSQLGIVPQECDGQVRVYTKVMKQILNL